jgi:hypothetical protein
MRWIACIPVLVVAACGGGSAEQNKAETKAESIAAGQWELSSEVTAFNTVGPGTPRINTPVGTRATENVCVSAGPRPTAELFSGAGYRCSYQTYYGRHGRATASLLCTREGLDGNISITSEGQFGADSLEYTRDLSTALVGEGDVRISTRVTGRRTGDCAPASAEGNRTGT